MTAGKIEVTVAGIVFSGEGDQAWLGQQLDKILGTATEISKVQPLAAAPAAGRAGVAAAVGGGGANSPGPLASYIKAKAGDTSQVKRFLATADWLRLRGETTITTAKVSKALSDNQQKRLGNPADCLNQNVRKGHCEKQGDGFFITPEGLTELGHAS